MMVLLTPYQAEARIIGSLMATLIVAMPTLLYASRRGRLFDKEIWKYLLRVNIPLLPHYLSSALILRISEIVIGREHGNAALAKYSVGLSVGLALTFLSNALSQASSPWILRKIAHGKQDKVRELITLSLGALMSVSLILLGAAPEILAIITPPEYSDALPTVYPLALSVAAMYLSNTLSCAEAYYERSARASLPTVMTAVLSVAMAVIVLPNVDYRLSALFTLAAYIVLVTLSGATLRKISGESIVDGAKCTLIFAFGAFYALLMFLFRKVLMSRILLIIPIFPLLYSLAKKVYAQIRE
jgi:O-antigen/teichoic acid export membrane protein